MLEWLTRVITVDWFISDGTLLGSVRNRSFIEKDTDIDIVVDAAHAEIAEQQIRQACVKIWSRADVDSRVVV